MWWQPEDERINITIWFIDIHIRVGQRFNKKYPKGFADKRNLLFWNLETSDKGAYSDRSMFQLLRDKGAVGTQIRWKEFVDQASQIIYPTNYI